MDTVRVDLVHPCRRAGWFGAELTHWLLATASGLRGVRLRPVAVDAASGAAADDAPDVVATASLETFGGAKAPFGTFAPAGADARVLVVRDDGRAPDLAPVLGGPALPVALVAYGGRSRGRRALERARAALEQAGVPTPLPSLGLNAAAVRDREEHADRGFAEADALLWSLLLDDLREAAVPAA